MSEYTHRTIIVPAEWQGLAQALCSYAAEGDAGKGMFTTGISPNGASPPTHYISSGMIDEPFADILPLTTITSEDDETTVSTRPGNVGMVDGMAAQAGINLPPGTVAALLSAIDVSEQKPFTALMRLNLQLTQEENL